MSRGASKSETRPGTNLAVVLRRWRMNEDVSLRKAAGQIGVSAATWMRMEMGHEPEADTLLKLWAWLLRIPES